MTLISRSPRRPIYLLLIALILLIVMLPISQSNRHHTPTPILFFPVLTLSLIFWWSHRIFRSMADKVWDEGNALYIQHGPHHLHIPLHEIINISYTIWINPPMARIDLRQPGTLGRSISFIPRTRSFSVYLSYRHPELDALIERIDQERCRYLQNPNTQPYQHTEHPQ